MIGSHNVRLMLQRKRQVKCNRKPGGRFPWRAFAPARDAARSGAMRPAPSATRRNRRPLRQATGAGAISSWSRSATASRFIEDPFRRCRSIDANSHRSSRSCRMSSSDGTEMRPRVSSRKAAARSRNPARPARRASSNMMRCSASALRPFSAALRFNASTTSWGTSRTNS